MEGTKFPKEFIFRRLHSICGILLALFLIEHLITNSQAALLIGDDGHGFVRMVNFIHSLPYLPVIEITLLATPFLIHMIWGVFYALEGRGNFHSRASRPSLKYGKNAAFSWQRITAWLLLFGVFGHIVHMRILQHPTKIKENESTYYAVRGDFDSGLYTLAPRLDIKIFGPSKIQEGLISAKKELALASSQISQIKKEGETEFNLADAKLLKTWQEKKQEYQKYEALSQYRLGSDQVMLIAPNAGTAALMIVRDSFKSIWLSVIYTVYVLAACFHAFNGLWTSMITWGVTRSAYSQALFMNFCRFLMLGLSILGLFAIWGTYWLNLYQ